MAGDVSESCECGRRTRREQLFTEKFCQRIVASPHIFVAPVLWMLYSFGAVFFENNDSAGTLVASVTFAGPTSTGYVTDTWPRACGVKLQVRTERW